MIDVAYANILRTEELTRILSSQRKLIAGKELLEIGSGTGVQLQILKGICKSAVGIDIPDSTYRNQRQMNIVEYGGRHIPFPDASFDVVFSSNVIEHIKEEQTIHDEIRRVLRPSGVVLHVVPTSTWRLWTTVAHYPSLPRNLILKLRRRKLTAANDTESTGRNHSRGISRSLNALIPERHGEFGNRLTEYFLFRMPAWRRRFESFGWRVEAIAPLGLAYSGYSLFGRRLSVAVRSRISRVVGSSTVLFVLRPT